MTLGTEALHGTSRCLVAPVVAANATCSGGRGPALYV